MAVIRFTTPTQVDGTAGWQDAVAAAGFNALADNAGFFGSEINNSSYKRRLARFYFKMTTSTVTPTEGGHLAILVVPEGTSTNYPGGEDSGTAANLPPLSYQRGIIQFRTKATQAIEGGVEDIPIPPTKFKFYVINRAMNGSSALPASSTNMELKVQFYEEELA